jgi:hypothetical protein
MKRSVLQLPCLLVVSMGLAPISASAQAVLTPIEVTAPRFSPFIGPSIQLLNLFFQRIPNHYNQQGLARLLCQQARDRANDLSCGDSRTVPSAEQFFRDVMANTRLARQGASEYEQVANDFGYYMRDHGAGGPAAALDDLESVCAQRYSGSDAAACIQELADLLALPFQAGGFADMDDIAVQELIRGHECLEQQEIIDEQCGIAGGQ